MTRVRLVFLLGVLATTPAAAVAQTASASRFAGRLDPLTAAAVSTLIDSMVTLGVPGEPLVAKALEGASKQASGERIVLAVRNLGGDLRLARTAVGESASEAEVVAGASALRAGAPVEVLGRVKAACGSRSALLPLATLADLMTQGILVERASAMVLALAERGANDADYRSARGAAASVANGAPLPAPAQGRNDAAEAPAHPPTPPAGPAGAPARSRPAARP